MLSTGSAFCPVAIFREYTRRRPADCCLPDSRVYLHPIKTPNTEKWFTRQPLGKNSIGTIAKNMVLQAQLPGSNKTNHSGRKTAIQTLLHANVPPTDVVQLTGHKNLLSLNSYSTMSLDQQRNISHILSDHLASSCQPPSNPRNPPPSMTAPISHSVQTTTAASCSQLANINSDDTQLLESYRLDYDMINEMLDRDFPDNNHSVGSSSGRSMSLNVVVPHPPAYISGHTATHALYPAQPDTLSLFNNANFHGSVTVHVHQAPTLHYPPAKRHRSSEEDEE